MTQAHVPFRFDLDTHTYTELQTGRKLEHINGMLKRSGWIDDVWYDEAGTERGKAVHRLTADYDLGALALESCVSVYRTYLLAHAAAMKASGLEVLAVEVPLVHPELRFAGRPDRVVNDEGLLGPLEIKTGDLERWHPLQTAMQAILLEPIVHMPGELQQRLCLYLKANGRYALLPHRDPGDFVTARTIIRLCTR